MYDLDTSALQWFTMVPSWILQDVVVLLLATATIGFIIKHEKRPLPVLLEFFCFIFLYAAVYENLATVMGWYGYGRSIVMVFNVPITVPIIEFLFVYTAIHFCKKIKIPTWTIPLFSGAFGVIADLTLDPLTMTQTAATNEGTIGRWTWFISESDASVFDVPIYNFTGWFLLCGYATVFILLGRYWYKKSGHKKAVALLYPPLCMLGALALMVSPLSAFLLWLGPFFKKGGVTEYIMLGLTFAVFFVLLAVWRGRMREKLSWKRDYIVVLVFGVFHLSNIVFALIGGQFKILLFSLPFIALQMGVIAWGFKSRALPGESAAHLKSKHLAD
ncbi:MAG: carotenoid biosynthesis protein [Oscillospiraceae bacterium]|jgi:uncharacterized protein YhhL (DUF1145 family)|nr:carotenoid biosynthesis protein [Oscillospiraceae bacterium]